MGLEYSGAYSSIEHFQRDQTAMHYHSALGSLVNLITKQLDFLASDFDKTKMLSSYPLYDEAREFASQVEHYKSEFEGFHAYLSDLVDQLPDQHESKRRQCNRLMEDYNTAITSGRAPVYKGKPSDFIDGFEKTCDALVEDYLKIASVNIGAIHNNGIDNDEVRGIIYGALGNAESYLSLSAYFEKIKLTAHTSAACVHTGEKPPMRHLN